MPTPTYDQIAKTILGSAGTITFDSIPSTYTDLRIVIRHSVTNAGYALGFRINDNTNAVYQWKMARGINGGVAAPSRTNMVYGTISTQTGTQAALNNMAVIDFYSYATTNRWKLWSSQVGSTASQSAVDMGILSGQWNNTAAISKITIAECGDGGSGTYNTGNLLSGSSAILYGIKGI
jgi:hypothetical protein